MLPSRKGGRYIGRAQDKFLRWGHSNWDTLKGAWLDLGIARGPGWVEQSKGREGDAVEELRIHVVAGGSGCPMT